MTEIRYNPVELRIKTNGHAAHAPVGQDIVCAGVSALLFAAYAELRNRGFKFFADADEAKGYMLIEAYPSAEERHTCHVIFETVVAGLENIARHYPNNVKIVKEEK
jgi:uncharacterized protein YsxB (DUF464 family)